MYFISIERGGARGDAGDSADARTGNDESKLSLFWRNFSSKWTLIFTHWLCHILRIFVIAQDLQWAESLAHESLAVTRVRVDTCVLCKTYVGALKALPFPLHPLYFYSVPSSPGQHHQGVTVGSALTHSCTSADSSDLLGSFSGRRPGANLPPPPHFPSISGGFAPLFDVAAPRCCRAWCPRLSSVFIPRQSSWHQSESAWTQGGHSARRPHGWMLMRGFGRYGGLHGDGRCHGWLCSMRKTSFSLLIPRILI